MNHRRQLAQQVGLRHQATMVVAARHTVPEVAQEWQGFIDMPPVYATAMLIGFIEQTCVLALKPHLDADQDTVGVQVNISHVAATPVGGTVTAEVVLIAATGRRLTFAVTCRDDEGVIGEGTHERALVDAPRFLAKVAEKQERLAGRPGDTR